MTVTRRILCDLPGVYTVSTVRSGTTQVLAASELRGGSCVLIDPETGAIHPVWDGPGGTMSLVPTNDHHLFAVQHFYAGFDAAASIVVEASREPGAEEWTVEEKIKLPYLHRLAAVRNGDDPLLLACTLCAEKASVDDWSRPGDIYRISPRNHSGPAWKPVPVMTGLHRNHGLSLTRLGGRRVALVSGMEGLFSIDLPDRDRPAWGTRRLLDWDVSDVAAADWDGDGREELVTIEPFHGNRFVFYHENPSGGWQRIHEIPCTLGHSLWAGRALGRMAVIAGERLGEGRIQVLFPTAASPSEWQTLAVDSGTGGTNLTVLQATDQILEFVSANNDNNQVVLYRVER